LKRTALTLIAAALLVSSGVVAFIPAASGVTLSTFIRDVNTSWGTPSSPTGASPGDRDLSLTVNLQYLYSAGASTVEALLTLPNGFTLYDGTNQTVSTTQGGVSTDSIFQLTFGGIFLSPSLSLGRYNFSLDLWAYLPSSGSVTILPENLTLSVYVEGRPQILISAPTVSLQSGELDEVPILVTNGGTGNASQLSLSVSSPGVSILSPALDIPYLAAGSNATVDVAAFVPSSASGSALTFTFLATYLDPYGVQQSASQALGFFVSTTPAPQLSIQAGDTSLVPGATNSVQFTITNTGSVSLSQVHITAESPAQASVLTQFPVIAELGVNASVTDSIEIFVSGTLVDSPLALTFSSTYVAQGGVSGSGTQTVGLYTTGSSTSLPSVLVSVSSIKNEVNAGTLSPVSFSVENIGTASLESPVLSLSVSSPLVVIQNSSYAVPGGALQPGKSVTFVATVSSSTSATPGYYPASVGVSYIDQTGTVQSATFSIGLILVGNINLVIQSPQVSQGNTTLTVSGEILNEGFSSAYYASFTGSQVGARGTPQSDYVGEVDPNTPVPFSLTIPYTPSTSVRTTSILVNVTFKDSLGTAGKYASTIQTTLSPASSSTGSSSTATGSSSGFDLLTALELGVIAGLVIMAVAGYIYIRRSRSRSPSPQSYEREEKGVI